MPNNNFSNLLDSKILMALISISALALLTYAIADVYQRYQNSITLKAQIAFSAQPVAGVTQDKPTISGTRQVAAQSLFGKKSAKAKSAPQAIDAPITRLKLTLLGAIAADIEENSKAIIQIDNKQVAVLQVGDSLPGTNAMIHQIQPIQVVLIRNGKLERLAILRPELMMDEQGDGNDIPMKSSGSDGDSLLPPIESSRAPGSKAANRRVMPSANTGNPDLPQRNRK